MAFGIYTAEKRVVRDGKLVCFAGEKMTLDEAARRGLVGEQVKGPAAKLPTPEPDAVRAEADRTAELLAMSSDELKALGKEVGAEFANGATKAVMAEAIIAKEQA
ncbi:MAG: hypothetical protein IJ087_18970 [Eggerthellaceae bacterium]|nr:hypothetical protein [Eggerthellaceae bacterium]